MATGERILDRPDKMKEEKENIRIGWDWGTAYDLFVSLRVLHEPEKFDLRPSWAAGVRSRLTLIDREVLEIAQNVIHFPVHWIYSLPGMKDASTALRVLAGIPPAERLPALAISPDLPGEMADLLREVANRRSWNEKDRETLRSLHPAKKPPRPKVLNRILESWSQPEEFGERFLQALQAYQVAFFSEEEARILPVLQEALDRAQDLSASITLPALIEELSQGVHLSIDKETSRFVLAPSYWITPLIVFEKIEPGCVLMLFGARPKHLSLVPGEAIPDSMLRALKALADPTRLKILRYLMDRSLTPSQLARLLRLRAPTVIHHLNALRLAGLVHLMLEGEGEKRYAARHEAVTATFDLLKEFLEMADEA